MENAFTVHFLDPSSRIRAELSRTALALGYHAEVYSDFDELTSRPLQNGIIIARDDVATGGITHLIQRLSDKGIWLPVIACADSPSAERIVMAMKAGALDYLPALLDLQRLDETLARVEKEAVEFAMARRKVLEARNRLSNLSTRERQVLDWLTRGSSNKVIARELEISPRTVEIHRASMMSKLGAKHAAEAVRVRLEAQVEAFDAPVKAELNMA